MKDRKMKSTIPTEKRILSAACVEFANMGYTKARIRVIASNAGANLAAANYYFGSKAGLYTAVFKYLFEQCPFKAGETLEEHIESLLLESPESPGILRSRILCREFRDPTDQFEMVYGMFVKPRLDNFSRLVEAYCGAAADSHENRESVLNMLGLVMFYRENRRLADTYMCTESYSTVNARRLARRICCMCCMCVKSESLSEL